MVKYSPNGEFILLCSNVGDADGSTPIYIIDAETKKEVCKFVEYQEGAINSVCFSPDSKRILVSSGGIVCVCDIESGGEIVKLEGDEGGTSAVFSFDGRKIAWAAKDNTIHIVDFPPLQELIDRTRERFKDNPLTPEERRRYRME